MRTSKLFSLLIFSTILSGPAYKDLFAQADSFSLSVPISTSDNTAKQYFSGVFDVKIMSEKDKSFLTFKKLKFEILGPARIYKNIPARFQLFLLPEGYDDAVQAKEVYSHYSLFNPIDSRYPHIRIAEKFPTNWTYYPSLVLIGEKNTFYIDPNSIKWLSYLPYEFLLKKYPWKDMTPSHLTSKNFGILENINSKSLFEQNSLIESLIGSYRKILQSGIRKGELKERTSDVFVLHLTGPISLWDTPNDWVSGNLNLSSSTARGIEFLITFNKTGSCKLDIEFFCNLEIHAIEKKSRIESGSIKIEYLKAERKGIGEAKGWADLTLTIEKEKFIGVPAFVPYVKSYPQLDLYGAFGAFNRPIEKGFKNKFHPLGINLEFSKSNWNFGILTGSNYMEAKQDAYVLKTLSFYLYGKYSLLKFFNDKLDIFLVAGGLHWLSSFQYTKYPSMKDYYPLEKDKGFSYLLGIGTGYRIGGLLFRLQYQLLHTNKANFGKVPTETEFSNFYTLYPGSQQLQILIGYRFTF